MIHTEGCSTKLDRNACLNDRLLHPYDHARGRVIGHKEMPTMPHLFNDLADEELEERASLIDPLDMWHIILRSETAFNPNTPSRLLELLSKDETNLVRLCVTRNPSAPQSLVNQVKPTISRYFGTESFRGWRDLTRDEHLISPELAVALMEFHKVIPDATSSERNIPFVMAQIPRGYQLDESKIQEWIHSPIRSMQYAVYHRTDFIRTFEEWFMFIERADLNVISRMSRSSDVPSEVRAYIALSGKLEGRRHGR